MLADFTPFLLLLLLLLLREGGGKGNVVRVEKEGNSRGAPKKNDGKVSR